MRDRNTLRHVCLVLILVALVFSRDVYAYLDPGTGSLVFQAVVAAMAAAAYGLRSYWGRIRMLFGAREIESPVEPNDRKV